MNDVPKVWRYLAEGPNGVLARGAMSAKEARTVEAALRERRLVPITIRPETRHLFGDPPTVSHNKSQGAALKIGDLAQISAQLRELLAAGLPVASALKFAANYAAIRAQRAFLQTIVDQVVAGKTLSSALKSAAFGVPPFMTALVEVGEATGDLGAQFGRISAHYETRLALERDLRGKIAYPAALLVLTVATVVFLAFVVLPEFEGIFAASGAPPPPETALALGFGRLIREYGLFILVVGAIAVAALGQLARKRPALVERLKLSAPGLGRLLRYSGFASFFRTLSAMLTGGAPLARALPLSMETVQFAALRQELADAEAEVRVGTRFELALSRKTSCPAELVSLIAVGEETGELGKLTAQAAVHGQAVVDRSLKAVLSVLSPALTALMGLLTAGVIASVLTGVLSLNDAIR